MEKIWIYQLNKTLSKDALSAMQEELQQFVAHWDAHGLLLQAGAEIRYDHFVILKINVQQTPPSGCSIDTSVRFLKQLEQKFDVQLFDRLTIACLIQQQVQLFSINALKEAYAAGEIDEQTLTFNNLIDRYPQLESEWLIPLSKSWVYPKLQKLALS
jgi:hypothetical protein